MPPRRALFLTACPLVALAVAATTAAAPPAGTRDDLSGAWQVKRTCIAGCKGSTTATETVDAHGNNVFLATGSIHMALYLIGKQVLVHTSGTTALLTIKRPGQLMSGEGVTSDGATFTSTWQRRH